MTYDVKLQPRSLVGEVYSAEVAGQLVKEFTGASTACIFEPVILEGEEPDEREHVSNNDVWPKEVEHVWVALQVVHQSTREHEDEARALEEVPLMCHVFGVAILDSPCVGLTGIALILLTQDVVGEETAVNYHNSVVNRRDLL